jgi:hypothetical protein
VTLVHPIDSTREIGSHWQRRPHVAARPAQNDNRAGGGLCPICKGYASIGAPAAESCGKDLVRSHWECRACGHAWVTVLHVTA